jgi:hypothetical protein
MSPFLRQRSSSTSKQGVVVHTYVRVGWLALVPLNQPNCRRSTALFTICLCKSLGFFSKFAREGELGLMFQAKLSYTGLTAVTSAAALLPTFNIYYMDLDLGPFHPRAITFPLVPGRPRYQNINQLGTLPPLLVSIRGCLTVPVIVASRTRSKILLWGMLSFCFVIWATVSSGRNHGVSSYISARYVLGLGANAIESVASLINQHLNFIHDRDFLSTVI